MPQPDRTPDAATPRELIAALRADAEKWRGRAAAEGNYTDPDAERTLALLDEYDRLRRAVAGALEWWDGQQSVSMPRFLEDVTALMIHFRAVVGDEATE